MNKAVLHLNLKKKWFDMILSGEKKEEYREIKPYWARVFKGAYGIVIKGKYYHPTDVVICFSNGYHPGRRQMMVPITRLSITPGISRWGGDPDKQYYTLLLGKPELL